MRRRIFLSIFLLASAVTASDRTLVARAWNPSA